MKQVFLARGGLLALVAAGIVLSPVAIFAVGPPDAVISQKNRLFAPTAISVPQGARIRFTNDDPFLHQIFVSSASFAFDSDEQAPGKAVDITFPTPGDFEVLCGIHPKMSLKVQVK